MKQRSFAIALFLVLAAALPATLPAGAVEVQRVISPGGV